MKISMHQASAPRFANALRNLSAILDKTQAWAEAKKIDPAVPGGLRLIADMFPLSRQVQIASDSAKIGASRLAGVTPPAFEDNEKTIPELVARVRKTIGYLETLSPAQFEGAEDREIRWKTPVVGERVMMGLPYLLHQALPNLHFHCTTAYDILRHNGVALGKMDYLGREPTA